MTITRIVASKDTESWSTVRGVIYGMVNSLTKSPRLRAGQLLDSNDLQQPASTGTSPHEESMHDSISIRHDDRPFKRIKLSPEASKPSSTRPKPASASRTTTTKPPTKITRTEPHGDIVQTTNGVQTTLELNEDDIREHAIAGATPQGAVQSHGQSQAVSSKIQDKRTLRSHDEGGRLKSELATYFPNYEDVINDVPVEPEFLSLDTVIHIRAEQEKPPHPESAKPAKGSKTTPNGSKYYRQSSIHDLLNPSPSQPWSSPNRMNGAQLVDFSSIEKSVPHHPEDPLTDAFYFKPHRRAERKEKQLRNIEKERAMHEKVQLERLLEGLQGHDWLRVLGVTGVTDSEAKRFEEKRDYFVSEVKALVLKFKLWKEEEKRMRLEKEAASFVQDDQEEEEQVIPDSDDEPSSSEIDASAARQLQMEASGSAKHKTRQRMPPPPPAPVFYRPPSPEGPFTSFYSKPHLRAAAIGKQRHGRNTTAFGVAIPEPEEHEFSLPADYTTPEALRESARRRRRMKRESAADSTTK